MKTYENDSDEEDFDCGLALVKVRPHDSISEKIGEVILDDFGISVNCSERKTINYLKKEACSRGAEIVLVRQMKRPDGGSYCFRCSAVFYKYKTGAKHIQSNKYFDAERIKKRDMRDSKAKIGRTVGIIAFIHRIFTIHEHSR